MDIPGDDDPDVSGNVFTQKSKHEPEEFDPESLGPPTPTPSGADYQSDVAGLFVKLVVVFNVALLALALGPMLAYFRGQVDLGSRVFLVGVVFFGYGTYEYLQFTRRDTDDTGAGDDETSDGEGVDAGDSDGGTAVARRGDHNG
ncbi:MULTISPECIES: DUF7322 domain-containing protein [Haloarcula]|uniref:DUF7322 domain-containing protein n=1 Tax=Haloarcula TaxID=2237 RepID=UPI0023ED6EB1|nr:hypothetical protein [Halomicroarcula sp. XH51]